MRRTQGGAGKRFRVGVVVASVAATAAAMAGWAAPAALAADPPAVVAYTTYTVVGTGSNSYAEWGVGLAGVDGSGAHQLSSAGYPETIALSPDGSEVAEYSGSNVETGSTGGGSLLQVDGCPCRGDLRWVGDGTLLVGASSGDRIINVGTRSARALPNGFSGSVLSLSPDLALAVSVDPRAGTLAVTDVASGRLTYRVAFPTGALNPRLPVTTDVSWSPDGATLAVSLTESNYDTEPVQKLFFVNARTGAVGVARSGLCTGVEKPQVSWDPAGASVIVGCPSGAVLRVNPAGSVTSLPAVVRGPVVAIAGGPQAALGEPVVAVSKVSAKATAAGQVTISASLPAADVAGAEVTGSGGADYGRLLGSKLAVSGLAPSKSYSFTVTPKTWAGVAGPHTVVKVKTEKAIGTVTTISALSTAVFGSQAKIQVKVTRGDNGHGVAKRPVTLRRSVLGGKYTTVGRGVTNSAGVATFTLAQRDDSTFTASETGSPTVGASSSTAKQVLARIHMTVTVEKGSGSSRLVTAVLDPARLVHGVEVEADVKYPYVVATCLPVEGGSAHTITCKLPAGKKYVLEPLGPVYDGSYEPDGPSVVVTVKA